MSSKKPSTSGISPVGKKLVQARLPFKTVAPKDPTSPIAAASPKSIVLNEPPAATDSTRKRKRSVPMVDANRPAKVNKIDERKENIETAPVVEVISLSTDDETSQETVGTSSKSEEKADPVNVKTPQSSRKKKSATSDKTPQQNNKKTPKQATPRSASKKRRASSPLVIVNDDDDENQERPLETETNFLIKLPSAKKRLSVKAKTPTRPTRSKSVTSGADCLAIQDDDKIDEQDVSDVVLVEASSPKKGSPQKKPSTPKKSSSPSKKPVTPQKSATPKKSAKTPQPASQKKTPIKAASPLKSPSSRPSRSKSVLNSSVVEKEKNVEPASSEKSIDNESTSKVTDASKPEESDLDCSILIEDEESNGSLLNQSQTQASETKSPSKTPKRNHASVANHTDSERKLTQKQQRKIEADNRQKEKIRQKEERERKLAEEREEKKEKEEQKRREKEEQREKKRLEEIELKKRKEEQKEEERKRKEEQKEEERKRKEEQKEEERKRKEEQKEEERKRKEDEKLAKEEAGKNKNKKEAAAFTKFFVKQSSQKITSANDAESNDAVCPQNFMPFRVKDDMKVAPCVRRVFSENHRCAFDENILVQKQSLDRKDLYIEQLKCGSTKRGRSGKTWLTEDNEVVVVDDELECASAVIEEPKYKQRYRAKYYKFHENRRPAYRGTWRKSSAVITPRRPFKTDEKFFDYEVDSDDEWEEEEPGESLHGSDDEKDKESDDDYDIDNEFFVPHGHLSDEEVLSDDEADDEDNTPEAQKAKLKIVQMEFADEMKKKTQKIKPRVVGLIYQEPNGTLPTSCISVIENMLRSRTMVFEGTTIKLLKPVTESVTADGDEDPKGTNKKQRRVLTDSIAADLIRLIHGNVIGKDRLVQEFQAFISKMFTSDDASNRIPNSQIRMKIGQLAKYQPCPDEGDLQGKFCWYVPADIREKYGVRNLCIPNTWTYNLDTIKLMSEKKSKPIAEPEQAAAVVESTKPIKSKFNISNFAKVLSDEEKQKHFQSANVHSPQPKVASIAPATAKPVSTPTKSTAQSKSHGSSGVVKKRVNLLMSVPRGQEIPATAKNALISNFLKGSSSAPATPKSTPDNVTTETIFLD